MGKYNCEKCGEVVSPEGSFYNNSGLCPHCGGIPFEKNSIFKKIYLMLSVTVALAVIIVVVILI